MRGVNLGNWLVLEKWMAPDLFYGIEAEDEADFHALLTQSEAEKRLKAHRDTYITERDFIRIKSMGLDLVRIPVPYHIFGDVKPFIGSIEYLDRAFQWAEANRLKILIDLHTVPESQNGFDNGGICGMCRWHTKRENVDKTLEVLGKLAERYGKHKSLFGIQPVNEPISELLFEHVVKNVYGKFHPENLEGSSYVPTDFLKKFYLEAYEMLRKYMDEDKAIVFHDGFRLDEWEDFMPRDEFRNVYFDTHIYLMMAEMEMKEKGLTNYLDCIVNKFKPQLERASKYHDIFVGEWSLANNVDGLDKMEPSHKRRVYRMLSEAQMYAWECCCGWIFWSYKLYAPNREDWDFCRAVDMGLLSL